MRQADTLFGLASLSKPVTDMQNDAITPVLLSPISDSLRVDYRYPVALDDGTAFVTGLTSNDGATGADGPTYQIDLNGILK